MPGDTDKQDPNKHIWEYLRYYVCQSHPPRYAVMLNGEWGIGKTYLIKKFISELPKNPSRKIAFVSLFGIRSRDDLDAAVFRAIYPILDQKGSGLIREALNTAFRWGKVNPDAVTLSAFLNKFVADIYIFDDLERCDMDINSVLGFINEFVEQQGRKVIVVANEVELNKATNPSATDNSSQKSSAEPNEYSRRREKLIGKTLEVQPSFSEAFAHFVSEIDNPITRKFYAEHEADIKGIFVRSGSPNLRILQQTMWDFARFSNALCDKHRANPQAMLTLLNLLFALSFDVKAGRLKAADMTGRHDQLFRAAASRLNNKETNVPFDRSAIRYSGIDLTDTVLSDELIVNILIKGIIEPQKIAHALEVSRFFISVAEEPAWRTVWHYFERRQNDVQVALRKLEDQFIRRQFTDVGEILHVFGLRLFLSGIGSLQRSKKQIVEDCKSYVDDLYNAKELPAFSVQDLSHIVDLHGHGGLEILEKRSSEFKEVYAHLKARISQAFSDNLPAKGEILLREMETNPELFCRKIHFGGSNDSIYSQIPIFASINPQEFVDALLRKEPIIQREIFLSLQARYKHGDLERELTAESSWLKTVRDEILQRASQLEAIERYRLEKHVEWGFEALTELEKQMEDQSQRAAKNTENGESKKNA